MRHASAGEKEKKYRKMQALSSFLLRENVYYMYVSVPPWQSQRINSITCKRVFSIDRVSLAFFVTNTGVEVIISVPLIL